ncbi:low molecular weight phosphatase family protein [Aequorivita sp. CIP111184]|uniref:arsenate-mycothiol transferase ArsC n=1 Tax=Aequorivita sp. CIP111184 TaxID=2211356 RepID=UPI000DBBC90B|nr:protein-tyrosine-phosphatase [Aequorivita sp. CIP111184]SRX54449.1 Protein ArsC [Aequorivita sp. CIP111184]
MFKELKNYIEKLDTATLSEERKGLLKPLIDYIKSKSTQNQPIFLNFICTHNSRRSHLAQIWAQTMADYFDVPNINCFSGGTEATAVYPMVVKTLKNAGFQISKETSAENPVYLIKYSIDKEPILGFSKKYDDDSNPKSGFAAVMTCSQADAGCPFVAGSEKRISIMYKDPKISDGTPQKENVYKERSEQIATEMKYVFSKINL